MRRIAAIFTAVLIAMLSAGPGRSARAAVDGFQVGHQPDLGSGVEHLTLTRGGAAPESVHVAHIRPDAPVGLRAVLSNDRFVEGDVPGARFERTSSMCARVHCLAAVNADFGNLATGEPIGGFASEGRLTRSPVATHHQLVISADGKLAGTPLEWSATLVPLDLHSLAIGGLNVDRGQDALVLYTPEWGPSTLQNSFGADLVGRWIDVPALPRAGQTAVADLIDLHDGEANVAIPADGFVLSGHGKAAEALRAMWARLPGDTPSRRALLRVETNVATNETVGGTPILLRDGKRWFGDDGSDFLDGRHPRTVVGWNPGGDVFLVTVDGRQPGHSVGMALAEAADLLLGLGATDAINLDGGGSTTFVGSGGQVLNQPSDVLVRRGRTEQIVHEAERGDTVVAHVERPVVSALAIVPKYVVEVPKTDPLAPPALGLPQALKLPVPRRADPASIPGATLPAVVGHMHAVLDSRLTALAVALLATVAIGLARASAREVSAGPVSRGVASGGALPSAGGAGRGTTRVSWRRRRRVT